jgi:uncharacterized RDD family membrane protein YckC
MVEKLKLPSPEVPSDTSAQVLPEKGTMSTPNNQNPYDPENSSSGLPSYNDYSQGAGENYNQAYNDGYGEPNGAGFEQFPDTGDQQYLASNELPGVGRRFAGFLIDSIIIGIISGALGSLIGVYPPSTETGDVLMTSALVLVVWFIARVGSDVTWGGTPGKRILKMKVVTPAGDPVDAMASLKRNLWVITQIIPIIGGLVQLVIGIVIMFSIDKDPQKQSFNDKFSGTKVIRTW